MIQLTLTLKMTTAQVVETSVTVNNNSPNQDYVHPDDQTQPTFISYLALKLGYINKTHNNSPNQDYVHPDDQTQPTFISYLALKLGYINKTHAESGLEKSLF